MPVILVDIVIVTIRVLFELYVTSKTFITSYYTPYVHLFQLALLNYLSVLCEMLHLPRIST